MHAGQLSPNLRVEPAEPTERSEEAAIQSEIFRAFGDLRRDVGRARAGHALQKMYALYQASPTAFWLVQRVMEGDLSLFSTSYAQLGAEECKSKQAVQQETERAMAILHRHYPKAAAVIVSLFGMTAEFQKDGAGPDDTRHPVTAGTAGKGVGLPAGGVISNAAGGGKATPAPIANQAVALDGSTGTDCGQSAANGGPSRVKTVAGNLTLIKRGPKRGASEATATAIASKAEIKTPASPSKTRRGARGL
jgi:hypothetical protein